MIGLSPILNIENNENVHLAWLGKIVSRTINVGQNPYIVISSKDKNLEKIQLYRPTDQSSPLKISLLEKTVKVIFLASIFALSYQISPLFLLIPGIVFVANGIFRLCNPFLEVAPPAGSLEDFKSSLNEWKKDSNVKGDKEYAAARILEAFINNSTELNLSNLRLTGLPSCIGKLTQLKTLVLSNKNLFTISKPDFSGIGQLYNLEILDIGGNNLTKVPSEIKNLTKLKKLYAIKNKISDLSSIGELNQLELLQLNENNLTAFPSEITKLTKLVTLSVNNNNISDFQVIGKLSNLTRLCISSNGLTELPAPIGELRNLELLEIDSNTLEEFPAWITNLTNLKWLYADNNKISELPKEIGYLDNLEDLSIANNKLSTFPAEIKNLTKLKKLNASSNSIKTISTEIRKLSLHKLNLNFNTLKSIHIYKNDFLSLNTLELSHTSLESFTMEDFSLSNLTNLVLSINHLNELPKELVRCVKLNKLNISCNDKLSTIPPGLLESSNLIEIID